MILKISECDGPPLKMCIQCVATLTAWHEYYNSCCDVNRRLKAVKLKSIIPEEVKVLLYPFLLFCPN